MKWLIPPVLWLFLAGTMAVFRFMLPDMRLFASPLSLAGLLPLFGGIWLLAAASRQFKRKKTNIHTFRAPDTLVTDGIFAVTRNPMYLGFVLTLLGFTLLLDTAVGLFMTGMFFVAAHFWYIPYEEKAAHLCFGANYDAYCSRVRRWI